MSPETRLLVMTQRGGYSLWCIIAIEDDCIRIISARRAENDERQDYLSITERIQTRLNKTRPMTTVTLRTGRRSGIPERDRTTARIFRLSAIAQGVCERGATEG